MTTVVKPARRWRRMLLAGTLVPLGLLVLLWGVCFVWVAGMGAPEPPERADVGVVLGAAVWANGKPSPVFARRIHAAALLWKSGRVAWLATTGGVGEGKHGPSEGDTARKILIEQEGIPAERILTENRSHTTWENLSNLRPELQAVHAWSLLIVSDGYHLARSVRMARDLGFGAWGVGSDGTPWQSVRVSKDHWFRETNLLLAYLFARPFL